MKNIQVNIHRLIENNIAVRKLLKENLVNIRALSRKFIRESKLTCSPEAVISAIRRYKDDLQLKDNTEEVYRLLEQAKLTSRMKLCSFLLKKNKETRKGISKIISSADYEGGDMIRLFEVTKYFKIITDQKMLPIVKKNFDERDIVQIDSKLSELSVVYNADISRTPGLFITLSNELSANNISILDSMICFNEHVVILSEENTKQAFDIVFDLVHPT